MDIFKKIYPNGQKTHGKMLNIIGHFTREVQIKTIMRHHFTPTRMAIDQLISQSITSVGED